MGMTSDFTKNPVLAGNTADASKWYQSQGYKWTPNGWQRPNNYVTEPGQFGGSGGSFAFGTSSSYPDRTLPSWYPKMGEITSEAETAYTTLFRSLKQPNLKLNSVKKRQLFLRKSLLI
jgi:hypothetical protein